MVKLSVIVPAYNEERCLEATLKAASHPDAELIVVCNGCTDGSAGIAKNFADKVFVLDEPHVSKARNFGASKASADRLVFLDADIVVEKDVLGKIADSRFSVGTCLVKPDPSKVLYVMLMRIKSMIHRFGFCSGLIFCDRVLFNEVGGYDESKKVGEDGELLRSAKRCGKYGVVDAYVFNNMRRFEKLGLMRICLFWAKHYVKNMKDYEAIR